MKLINYKRGYNNTFDCSIHGTIKMTKAEFDMVIRYLLDNADTIKKEHSYFNSILLKEDLERKIHIRNSRGISQGFFINIRVSATEAFVKYYNLRGYKRGNYQIEVDTSVQTNYSYLVTQATE